MRLERLAAFIFGTAILAYLFSRIELGKIKMAVLSLNPLYMLAFFSVLIFTVVLKGLKWKMSLGIFRIPTGLLNAVEMWVIGFSIGAATPGRVGDFVKIAYLNEKKGRSIGAVILDRLTDVFAVLFFALLGLGIFGNAAGATKQAIALSLFALLAGAAVIKRYSGPLLRILFRQIVPEKYKTHLKSGAADFFESLAQALKRRKNIASVFFMSVFIWMISGLQGFIIAKSLGISIAFFPLLFIMSIVALVELIPVTVAGLGTREATIVFLMSFLGIESEKAIVFSLVNFAFGYLALACVGYLFWLRNPIKLSLKQG